jgi:quercetin dioxygenase-like cupin family protein
MSSCCQGHEALPLKSTGGAPKNENGTVLHLDLELHEIQEWSSEGVRMQELLRRDDPARRTHIAHFDAGSVLGRHVASLWQLFAVMSGSGWVAGEDRVRYSCVAGDTFIWSPGESHESGSDLGMTVAIVQSDQPFPL